MKATGLSRNTLEDCNEKRKWDMNLIMTFFHLARRVFTITRSVNYKNITSIVLRFTKLAVREVKKKKKSSFGDGAWLVNRTMVIPRGETLDLDLESDQHRL